MRRAILGGIMLAILTAGCLRISQPTPAATVETAAAAAAPLPTQTMPLPPTSTPEVRPSRALTMTKTASPLPPTLRATSTEQASRPTAAPKTTPSPVMTAPATASPSVGPPTATVAAPGKAASPTTQLPQEVTTVVPEASWPYVSSLVVTPDDPPQLYAVIEGRLYRSTDGARNWQAVDLSGIDAQARITSVAMDYRHAATMYLLTSAGIYRREGKEPWSLVHTLNASALAVDLLNPDILWAGVPYRTEYDAVLLKSSDRGRTWGKADDGMFGGPGGTVGQILIDPTDPNIIFANMRYAGRFGWPLGSLFRGGRDGHWEQLDVAPQWGAGACLPHGLALDPDLRRLYVGCDVYYYNERQFILYQSDDAYAANSAQVTWNTGTVIWPTEPDLAYGAVRPLAVGARRPKTIYLAISEYRASVARHVLLTSEDDGKTWQALPLP